MKHYIKIAKDFSVNIFGLQIPKNSLYGRCVTSYGDTTWYCDNLNYCADDSISVHIYNTDAQRWITRCIHNGQIYKDIESMFLCGSVRIGTKCIPCLRLKGTFQNSAITKKKCKSFKEANTRWYDRGSHGGKYTWELRQDTGLISAMTDIKLAK